MNDSIKYDDLGYGIGLRVEHYDEILAQLPAIDWLEILSENFLVPGGRPLYYLQQIRQHYPMVMHGVSLGIGNCDPIDWDYLKQLKNLANRIQPAWISDHLCWTGVNGFNLHDLLPLPYTEEALAHVVMRVRQVQDYLGQRILLENPSSYIRYRHSTLSEWEFVSQVAKQADCLILLDINNVYVSAYNHGFSAIEYINAIPSDRVQQFHLAGHSHQGSHIIDSHDATIIDEVWRLYQHAVKCFPGVSTLLERDDHIPSLDEMLKELARARQLSETTEVLDDSLV